MAMNASPFMLSADVSRCQQNHNWCQKEGRTVNSGVSTIYFLCGISAKNSRSRRLSCRCYSGNRLSTVRAASLEGLSSSGPAAHVTMWRMRHGAWKCSLAITSIQTGRRGYSCSRFRGATRLIVITWRCRGVANASAGQEERLLR